LAGRDGFGNRFYLLAQFCFQPSGHPPHLPANRPAAQVLTDRQHLLEELKGQSVGDQGRELGFQVSQFRRAALGQVFRQGTETRSSFRLALATVQPRAVQLQFAKRGAEHDSVVAFARALPAAKRTAPCLGHEFGGLPLGQGLLQPG